MPGAFHLSGAAFDKEIENDAFVAGDHHHVRMIEENDIVVAEGRVQAKRGTGGVPHRVFRCLRHEQRRIRRLTTTWLK